MNKTLVIQTTPYRKLASLALMAITALCLSAPVQTFAAAYKRADKTGKTMGEFRDEIVNIKKQVDATMAALDKIVETAVSDPRKAFAEFDKSVPRVEDAAKKARKRAEDMKAQGQGYFKQWEKEMAQIEDPEIRALAEQRKAKLQSTFDSIRTVMDPAREQFNTWLSHLQDLQKFLGSDLTIAGVDAAKEQIAKAKTEGHAVQVTMDKVIAELNTVVATITPAKNPPPKK